MSSLWLSPPPLLFPGEELYSLPLHTGSCHVAEKAADSSYHRPEKEASSQLANCQARTPTGAGGSAPQVHRLSRMALMGFMMPNALCWPCCPKRGDLSEHCCIPRSPPPSLPVRDPCLQKCTYTRAILPTQFQGLLDTSGPFWAPNRTLFTYKKWSCLWENSRWLIICRNRCPSLSLSNPTHSIPLFTCPGFSSLLFSF